MPLAAPTTAPYGSWRSPITAQSLTAHAVQLATPTLDGDDVYWLEGRPSESGRVVLVRRRRDGSTDDVTPAPFNVRSRVHEYGGGAFTVHDAAVYFTNFADQRVYRLDLEAAATEPRPITPEGDFRYADLQVDSARQELICVRENHSDTGSEPVNTLVRLGVDGPNDDGGRVLVDGSDFVSTPRLSPDGTTLAWLQWNHPNMPWDGTELRVASVNADGSLGDQRLLAGGEDESILQPTWSPGGGLTFLSDRTGWWNLYAVDATAADAAPTHLLERPHEFGGPLWVFGMSWYAHVSADTILCSWVDDGFGRMGLLDLAGGELSPVPLEVSSVRGVAAGGGHAVLHVGALNAPDMIVRLDLGDLTSEVLRRSSDDPVDAAYTSTAEPATWEAPDGDTVHGFYYAPHNPEFVAPSGTLPPLVVCSHGGPTAMSPPDFNPAYHYWTSRGFAVLDVNYRGSAGYGRSYRQRLNGNWGVVDVDDCASGAQAMAGEGRVDAARMAIRGGSAGGYTTLAALAFRDVFSGGASYFGVSDLEVLARDTHKFESRYLEKLVGPYPQARDLYVERSPLHHVDRLSAPMILLQGLEDEVVPPNQAELMADALRSKGLPVALIEFDGEGHGFRRSETIVAAVEAELYFYSRVFGFEPADPVPAVEIANLPAG